uniref:Uncharacterized protein n=1 Tax=Panagrolaimus davidi TaxID=227884 RepID=A0A914Q2D5_9BILA
MTTQNDPGGMVTMGTTGAGCISYTVTCPASTTKAVVIGANQAAIQLSTFTSGAKMATLTCNNMGQIQGTTVPGGAAVTVTDVYCSRAN